MTLDNKLVSINGNNLQGLGDAQGLSCCTPCFIPLVCSSSHQGCSNYGPKSDRTSTWHFNDAEDKVNVT